MAAKPDADETATDERESTSEHTEPKARVTGVAGESGVFVPLCEADIERIRLELEHGYDNEHSPETVEEFIERAVHLRFAQIDSQVEETVRPQIEVPPAQALRAQLRLESAKQRGMEIEDEDLRLNDYLMDLIQVIEDYKIEDEPSLNESSEP